MLSLAWVNISFFNIYIFHSLLAILWFDLTLIAFDKDSSQEGDVNSNIESVFSQSFFFGEVDYVDMTFDKMC